ncbi:KilA-N domain-containing protein [Kiloniella sp.]|uniref:KilA-N domain-containing protein n=1 Tax=Kiloniella sp. TaxID=1938587 RepID=UPI003B020168
MSQPAKVIVAEQGRGDRVTQGTWVHPKVAIHLAQWLSPEFAVQVTNWVFDWMNGGSTAAPQEPTRHISSEESHVLYLCDEASRSMEGFHRLREFCAFMGRKHSKMEAQLINVHSLLQSQTPQLETFHQVRTQTPLLGDVATDLVVEFLKAKTIAAPKSERVLAKTLFSIFLTWCKGKGYSPFSQATFGRALSSIGLKRRKNGITYYHGIQLLEAI